MDAAIASARRFNAISPLATSTLDMYANSPFNPSHFSIFTITFHVRDWLQSHAADEQRESPNARSAQDLDEWHSHRATEAFIL